MPELSSPLHLVVGPSGAGCVRAACDAHGMPGRVFGFSDELAHGPLDDREARLAYLQGAAKWSCSEVNASDVCFFEWDVFQQRLRAQSPDAVIVWRSANVTDAIFEAMACHSLKQWPGRLMHIQVPGAAERPFVAMHSPDQIARFFTTRQILDRWDRQRLALDFERIRTSCGPLRQLQQGQAIGAPIDQCDPLLFGSCGPDWRPAMQVVGEAMGLYDGQNLLSDVFFVARLGSLIEGGHIEACGPPGALKHCSVRLRPSVTAASVGPL